MLSRNNFWHISIPADCSWIWRKILKLRPIALNFLNYSVGNGNFFSLWLDPWLNGQASNQSVSLPPTPESLRMPVSLLSHPWVLGRYPLATIMRCYNLGVYLLLSLLLQLQRT